MMATNRQGAIAVRLLYDPRDERYHERVGSRILYWLDDLGALPLPEADPAEPGFLFAGARPIEDFARGRDGTWWWIEAGPDSCAGTAHEHAFKAVASRLTGERAAVTGDAVGGPL